MNFDNLINFEGLSTEAKVGKILVLIAFILKIVGILVMLGGAAWGSAMFLPLGFDAMFGGAIFMGIMAVMIVVSLVGIFLVWKAFDKMDAKDFHGAAIFSVIAAFLPPLDVIVLIGAILLFISPEAKK